MIEKGGSPIVSLNCTFWSLPAHDPKAELKTTTSSCLSWWLGTGQLGRGDPLRPPAAAGRRSPIDEHDGTKGQVNHLSSHSCQVQQRCKDRC